jgi:hypothetical protein
LKAPGFNPCTYQVRNRFQAFAFKWVNLYRYGVGDGLLEVVGTRWGLYELNPVVPELESTPGFNPWKLKCDLIYWFPNLLSDATCTATPRGVADLVAIRLGARHSRRLAQGWGLHSCHMQVDPAPESAWFQFHKHLNPEM